jgi:hypothetical protein
MRWLLASLLVAAVPLGAAAQAPAEGEPAATPPPSEGPGNGPVLGLSVFTMSSLSGPLTGVGSATELPSLAPLVQVGIGVGQGVFLVGFGLGALGGSGGSGTTFVVSGSSTLRYYLRPLQAGSFSPFGEATLGIGIAGSEPEIAFDLGGGLGGEWLFMKNFGLFGRATVIYEHINTGPNVDGIGLVGDVGLTAHL